jgi:hypothetical protein
MYIKNLWRILFLVFLGLLIFGIFNLPYFITSQPARDLRGTQIEGYDEQGNQMRFQIMDQEIDPKDPKGEISIYTVYYQDSNKKWQNLCRGDTSFPAKAVFLQGSWNKTGEYQPNKSLVTVSCANQGLGKCMRFGYKPWSSFNGHTLRDYHQACSRMVRADYCGDGVGHTKDGTPINIYDRLGIQKPDVVPNMSFEAAWGADGAVCINHVRWPEDWDYVKQVCPRRLAKDIKNCTTASQVQKNYPQALIFNDSVIRSK